MPSVFIPGPCGRIEARHCVAQHPRSPVAIVLHPNPQFGGSMNTLVVYTLFTAFQDLGCHVLRLNLRGVGRSDGVFAGDTSVLADASCALGWMRNQHPQAACAFIAGFSFGSWLGLHLARSSQGIAGCIAVAPPVNKLDFGPEAPRPVPGLVIHGAEDALVPIADVRRFVAKRNSAAGMAWELQCVEGASHFFENHQEQVAELATQWLQPQMGGS